MTINGIARTPLYEKALGCLMGGVIGDAMGSPTEGKTIEEIEREFGWVDDFSGGGTDDTVLRDILITSLVRTAGNATLDDWAQDWMASFDAIFGAKVNRFFISVLHTARKLKIQGIPRMAAMGSVPCSSAAMCMAPVGIVNACRPRQAALQAYNLASLMNVHDAGLSQDGAAAIAAAVAEACKPQATVDSIVASAVAYLEQTSGRAMVDAIGQALSVARDCGDYCAFRKRTYAEPERFFQMAKMNALETVPITLALFSLAGGQVAETLTCAANFGRDADTMAAMGGAIAGTLHGVSAIGADWLGKARLHATVSQDDLALQLVQAAISKFDQERQSLDLLQSMLWSATAWDCRR